MNSFLKAIGLVLILSLHISCNNQSEKESTIQEIPFPEGSSAILPHLVSDANDLYLSWVDTSAFPMVVLKYAKLENGKWSNERTLVKGEDWFVNWADYPMISIHNNAIVSHYLQNSASKGMAYDIFFQVSKLNEVGKKPYSILHADKTATEHGFVSMLPKNDSTFFLAWLDGRNMASHDHGSMHHHDHHAGEMSVRVAEVNLNGEIKNEVVLDNMACTCCQTTASMTQNGPVLLYRDCSADQIRDISIVRQVDGKWTEPKIIHDDHWRIEGCPVNGPKSDAIANSLAVAWYTEANGQLKVQVIFSNNGGESFEKPILISDKEVVGRVDIILLTEDEGIVSWMESKNKETYLYAAKVNKKSGVSRPREIAKLSSSRKAGFPQMERIANDIYFAWMDIQDAGNTLRTAVLPYAAF